MARVMSDALLSSKLQNAVEVLGIGESQDAVIDGESAVVTCGIDMISRQARVFLDWWHARKTANFGVTIQELIDLETSELDATILRRFRRAVKRVHDYHDGDLDVCPNDLYRD